MKIKETEAAIEAILFAMGGSVELPRIARAIGVDEKTTGRIIRNMMDRYQEENRGIQIKSWRILSRCVQRKNIISI